MKSPKAFLSPFFLLIIGLECLVLLISIGIGLYLYLDTSSSSGMDLIKKTVFMEPVLVIVLLLSVLFLFSNIKKIQNIVRSMNHFIFGAGVAVLMMTAMVSSNGISSSENVFIGALLSAAIGLFASQPVFFDKCCDYLFKLKDSFRQ